MKTFHGSDSEQHNLFLLPLRRGWSAAARVRRLNKGLVNTTKSDMSESFWPKVEKSQKPKIWYKIRKKRQKETEVRVTESVGGEEAWSFSYRVQSGLWRPSKQRNAISIAHSLPLQTSNLAVAERSQL